MANVQLPGIGSMPLRGRGRRAPLAAGKRQKVSWWKRVTRSKKVSPVEATGGEGEGEGGGPGGEGVGLGRGRPGSRRAAQERTMDATAKVGGAGGRGGRGTGEGGLWVARGFTPDMLDQHGMCFWAIT